MNAIGQAFYEECVAFFRDVRGMHSDDPRWVYMRYVEAPVYSHHARLRAYQAIWRRHKAETCARHVGQIAAVLGRIEERARRATNEHRQTN